MRTDLSPELRRQFFQQQSPVILVRSVRGSKPQGQRELEAIAQEMAAEYATETGADTPYTETTAIITDAWGSKIGGLGIQNGMISWAWVTPDSREERDYLMLALDVLQAAHPTLLVFPGLKEMQDRLAVHFHSNPHRYPGKDAYEQQSGDAQSPFATLRMG